MPGLARLPLADPVEISVYAVRKSERVLSSFAAYAIARLGDELAAAVANRPWQKPGAAG